MACRSLRQRLDPQIGGFKGHWTPNRLLYRSPLPKTNIPLITNHLSRPFSRSLFLKHRSAHMGLSWLSKETFMCFWIWNYWMRLVGGPFFHCHVLSQWPRSPSLVPTDLLAQDFYSVNIGWTRRRAKVRESVRKGVLTCFDSAYHIVAAYVPYAMYPCNAPIVSKTTLFSYQRVSFHCSMCHCTVPIVKLACLLVVQTHLSTALCARLPYQLLN